MKRMLTVVLACLLLRLSIQQASAPVLPALCIAAAGAVAIGGIVYLYSCGDKYYCGRHADNGIPEGAYYCMKLGCKRDAVIYDFVIKNGPFRNAEYCSTTCATNNAVVNFDTYTAHVLRTSDLTNWKEMLTVSNVDIECFEFELSNQPTNQAFYRIAFN